jgi:ribonuclease BN (tRNA processing enzyme)
MQIVYKDHLIIVDTGFGACNLGEKLMQQILADKAKLQIHIFYTHFHWDHIQGLPFFHPIYFNSTTLNIYSPLPVNVAHQNLDQLFDGSYSPFSGLNSMASTININELSKAIMLDGLMVSFCPVDHSHINDEAHCFALKFQAPTGESIVIATDHEARDNSRNQDLVNFAKGSTILVHDAQFTPAEYSSRQGWGHSTMQAAMKNGIAAGADRVLLTHHHPHRTDGEIAKTILEFKESEEFKSISFDFAKELAHYEAVRNKFKRTA